MHNNSEKHGPVNPFTPGFGEVPAFLMGRDQLLREARRAYESPVRRPELTLSISGARGTGKTALLSVLADEAQQRGWVAVNVMAIDGMLEDILIQVRRAASHLVKTDTGVRVSGFGIGDLISIDLSYEDQIEGNWRSRMSDVLDALAEHDVGLLLTVDEVQPSLDELVQLAATYQLFIRENRKVGLVLAGLPQNMSALLQDKSVSFLRRAKPYKLARLSDGDVRLGIKRTVEDGGKSIEEGALESLVHASEGSPFMLQLAGFNAWEQSGGDAVISLTASERGIEDAGIEIRDRILGATYSTLSNGDRLFLAAMCQDEGDSRIGDVAHRLGKTTAYATQYKKRLMEQGVIGERGRGLVGFDMPLMREYVREHMPETEDGKRRV